MPRQRGVLGSWSFHVLSCTCVREFCCRCCRSARADHCFTCQLLHKTCSYRLQKLAWPRHGSMPPHSSSRLTIHAEVNDRAILLKRILTPVTSSSASTQVAKQPCRSPQLVFARPNLQERICCRLDPRMLAEDNTRIVSLPEGK